jgi:hypothetical protein
VKGHQDAHNKYKDFSPTAKLNVDVDDLASHHYWSGKGLKPTKDVPHLGKMRDTISINGVCFPSKIDKQLRYVINGLYLKSHMQHHHCWNEKVWNLINFDSFATLPGRKQVQHMKYVHDIQPLGLQKQKMHKTPISSEITQCPYCCQDHETQLHIMLQCLRNPLYKQSIQTFHKDCSRKDGSRFLQFFGDLMGQWLSSPTI